MCLLLPDDISLFLTCRHPESGPWCSPCSWLLWGRASWTPGSRSPGRAGAGWGRRPGSCPAGWPAWRPPPARPETTSHLQPNNRTTEYIKYKNAWTQKNIKPFAFLWKVVHKETETTRRPLTVNEWRRVQSVKGPQPASCFLGTTYMLETTGTFEPCHSPPAVLMSPALLSSVRPLSSHNEAAGQCCVSCVIAFISRVGGWGGELLASRAQHWARVGCVVNTGRWLKSKTRHTRGHLFSCPAKKWSQVVFVASWWLAAV